MFKSILYFMLLASSASYAAGNVEQQATTFYTWYISQISEMKNPLADPLLKKYVTPESFKSLMHAYSANEINVDYFTQVQDFDDKDWLAHIKVEQVIADPICTNVYLSLGSINPTRIVDCFVKNEGQWQIKTVTALSPPR